MTYDVQICISGTVVALLWKQIFDLRPLTLQGQMNRAHIAHFDNDKFKSIHLFGPCFFSIPCLPIKFSHAKVMQNTEKTWNGPMWSDYPHLTVVHIKFKTILCKINNFITIYCYINSVYRERKIKLIMDCSTRISGDLWNDIDTQYNSRWCTGMKDDIVSMPQIYKAWNSSIDYRDWSLLYPTQSLNDKLTPTSE